MEKNTVPVWSGCFAPLRLVMLESDEWTPSIDQINTASYDKTKLFRSSLNIDVGISPLSLIITFDGTLLVPAIQDIPRERALSIFNKHLTNLLLGGLLVGEVEPDDISRGSLNFWGYHRHHNPNGRYSKLSQSLRTGRAGPDESILLHEPSVIREPCYRSLNSAGLALSRELPNNLYTVILPACTAFSGEKWERALILALTSAELIIEKMWLEKVVAHSDVSGIKQKRRKGFLSDTRTWNSSARIELLWRQRQIADTTYALLDSARSARNAFIHSANPCSPDSARSAVEALFHLIGSVAEEASLQFEPKTLMHLLDYSTSHFREPMTDNEGRLLKAPKFWRRPDPAPGFDDWGDHPFEKIPEVQLKPIR